MGSDLGHYGMCKNYLLRNYGIFESHCYWYTMEILYVYTCKQSNSALVYCLDV